MKKQMEVVQVGTMGLRSPTGEIVQNVPLFIERETANEFNPTTGRTIGEDAALNDIAKFFAKKFKAYAESKEGQLC